MKRLLALAAIAVPLFYAAASYRTAGWDWDEVLMIAMGFAGFAYIVVDQIRSSKLDDVADDVLERVTKLELTWAYAAEQSDLDALAVQVDRAAERMNERCDRLAEQAEHASDEAIAELAERVATIEARLDFKPVTLTRKKNGQFGAPEGEPPK